MRITRTLTTAIAIAALAAPAAQARPADPAQRDMHASTAIAASQQHATQRPLGQAGNADFGPQQPVTGSQPVTRAPVTVVDDGGVSWTTIALIAASLLLAGGVAAGIRRPRVGINV